MNKLSNFGNFALTRTEMKKVTGGSTICTCNKKGGTFTYATSTSSCAAPSTGAAYFEYSKNGKKYSGYVSSDVAAKACGKWPQGKYMA
ncbi:hypothetical protein ACO2Q8_25455 [Larkinella sp. VNQ87]|uniref:hypothetical protein n=1 Tax=Larkinella sp. VNQ87 TaxID=3400921 RepID=UPI003C02AC5A